MTEKMHRHPSSGNQNRLYVSARDGEDNSKDYVYISSKTTKDNSADNDKTMEPNFTPSHFEDSHSPKKLKSEVDKQRTKQSCANIPPHLCLFSQDRDEHYNKFLKPHQSGSASSEYTYSDTSRRDAMPSSRRARSHSQIYDYRSSIDKDHYASTPQPRRSSSDRIHYHLSSQSRGSSNLPTSQPLGKSAFDKYHHHHHHHYPRRPRGEFETSSSRHNTEDRYHQPRRQQPPLSYIGASARSCFPSTDLGKKIRDEVRALTEGTRLFPVAKAYHGHRNSISHEQQHQHHSSGTKTIRLLDSTREILEVHSILGRGTFAVVTAVTIKELDLQRERDHHQHGDQHCDRHLRYYACKSIQEELLVSNVARRKKRGRSSSIAHDQSQRESLEYCVLAASQLAYEAHLLSSLDHPNIVKLRGLDADGILGFEKRDRRGFFLLTDILSETLDQKIDKWRSETALGASESRQNLDTMGLDHDTSMLLRHLEKLGICSQLASALEYLHANRIVYRDLKPSNIGFRGDERPSSHKTRVPSKSRLQLFDFDLSRELTPAKPTLTGAIGTMRYMAPEVCMEDPNGYDCDCDIFSYAIVCWELWTQKIPFEDVPSPDLYRETVCKRDHRPIYRCPLDEEERLRHSQQQNPLIRAVPKEILALLSQCWKADPKTRNRWPKTKHQLELLSKLVGLRLEERELSESNIEAIHQGQQHARPPPPMVPNHNQMHASNCHYSHRDSHPCSTNMNDDDWEPLCHNEEDNHSHFSLRDEDLNLDLGI